MGYYNNIYYMVIIFDLRYRQFTANKNPAVEAVKPILDQSSAGLRPDHKIKMSLNFYHQPMAISDLQPPLWP